MREDETYRQERPVVYLIGIGMGGEDQLTGQAIDRLEGAEAVMGAGRMLGSVEPYIQGKPVLTAYKPSEMVQDGGRSGAFRRHGLLQWGRGCFQGLYTGRLGCGIYSGNFQSFLFLRQNRPKLAGCISGKQSWTGVRYSGLGENP